MTYTQMLPYLIQNGTVVPRALPPMPKPHKPWYDENARCAFHANSEGHTTENCKVFKLRVQELIDQKILSFADVPNVGNNPLPKHDGSGVNAIESSTDDGLIKDVFKLKTLLTMVHARLMEAELMNEVHDNCVVCSSNPNQCGEFKIYLQRLMDQRVIQFIRAKIDEDVALIVPIFDQERLPKPFVVPYQRNVDLEPVKKIEPMVIHVPAPFLFDSTKVVPWNYELVVYVGNKPIILKEPDVTNIAGASGVTRSGWVFAPEVIPNKESAPTVEPTKGKKVNPPEVGEGSSKKAVTAEEDREFLKIIKKEKKDKCGLGYQPSIELFKDQKIHQGKVPSIQEIFSKAGFRSDDQVNALEDEDPDFSKMVFCGPPDAALTNWKATDLPDIVSCSK
ncbi:hypothetical protein KIW84_050493 [Lathyrus oleraceus]|uniref:Gag-pro-like protein n=1 Tax=Pisum sativum TaxID=3888 RepID=A0A9D4WJW0_PEA|nr:hypothetical protein KIW84_050493 [Pisum sativum]